MRKNHSKIVCIKLLHLPYLRIFQFGTFDFCISFLTSSSQRIFGLPIGLLEMCFQQYIALTILVPCILSMWPSYPSLCAALMEFIVPLRFIIFSNSWLDFIRQIPFSLVGPNIFFKSFLSIYSYIRVISKTKATGVCTRVGTLIVATIYLQLIQNRYMFQSFTVLQCSHQHCVQPVASDMEVVGYL